MPRHKNTSLIKLNSNLSIEIQSVEQRTFIANKATSIALDGKHHLVIMSGTYSGYDRTPTNVTISSGTIKELKVKGNNGSYYIAFTTTTETSVDVTVINANNRPFISYITIL